MTKKKDNELNLEKYLNIAKNISRQAEKIALKYFGFQTETEWKEDNSPLTIADKEINNLVIEEIKREFPSHSVYGEESSNFLKDSRYIWVCDPIDGTMPYSCGLPMFTFSLALVDQQTGLPILGVVNDPIMKNMYWAIKDKGAFRNGKRIGVTKTNKLERTYLNVDGGDKMGFSTSETIQNLKKQKTKIMCLASVIYGGIQVANGKFSGTIFFNPFGHDVAALKIITEEAGGKVTDLNGNERRYDQDGIGCVISNSILHNEILNCISRK